MATDITSKVYTQDGKESGTVTLPATVFGLSWNADLVSQVAVSMAANAREGTAHTKTRGEVRGGGKKPWKQKGTGRARHGSRRSPIWIGGGVTHGPRSDKNYTKKINKQMKTKALWTVLSAKYRDGEVLFVDSLSFDTPKTKTAKEALGHISRVSGHTDLVSKRKNAAIIAVPEKSTLIEKSFGNMKSLEVQETRSLNALALLNTKYVIFVSPDASIKLVEGRKKKTVKAKAATL